MFKVNEYFDGTVKSIAFGMTEGPATIGVMAAGEYEFGTSQLEVMHVIAGALTVKLPGSDTWETFAAGSKLRYLAPDTPGTYIINYVTYVLGYPSLRDTAQLVVTVLDNPTNAPPTPRDLTGRVASGQSVQLVHDIVPASELVGRLLAETADALRDASGWVTAPA